MLTIMMMITVFIRVKRIATNQSEINTVFVWFKQASIIGKSVFFFHLSFKTFNFNLFAVPVAQLETKNKFLFFSSSSHLFRNQQSHVLRQAKTGSVPSACRQPASLSRPTVDICSVVGEPSLLLQSLSFIITIN